jgi:hypothetical protein
MTSVVVHLLVIVHMEGYSSMKARCSTTFGTTRAYSVSRARLYKHLCLPKADCDKQNLGFLDVGVFFRADGRHKAPSMGCRSARHGREWFLKAEPLGDFMLWIAF